VPAIFHVLQFLHHAAVLLGAQLAALVALGVLMEEVVVLLGAVHALVGHGLGVGPQPGQRPQHAAEDQGEQAQGLDRVALRVMLLVGDLLGQHVYQPEHRDHPERHHDQHHPGEHVGGSLERLAREERGAGGRGQRCAEQGGGELLQAARAGTRNPREGAIRAVHGILSSSGSGGLPYF
jgi:hypothetical protein